MSFSFIHTSDLHLGRGLEYIQSNPVKVYENLLEQIKQTALKNECSFILFAGDTFNSLNTDISIKKRFLDFIRYLGVHNIEVYYSCGNHDFLDEKFYEPFLRENNFHIFPETWKIFAHKNYYIHGYSFDKAAFRKNMLKDYGSYNNDLPNIFCFHTNISETNSEHENYAPTDICDYEKLPINSYFALGHIHKQKTLVNTTGKTVQYSGSPIPTRISETGQKGFFLVKYNSSNIFESEFIPSETEITEIEIDISGAGGTLEIDEKIQDLINNYETKDMKNVSFQKLTAYRIQLKGELLPEIKKELTENINDSFFENEYEKLYIIDKTYTSVSPHEIKKEKGLFEAMVRTWENLTLEDIGIDKTISELIDKEEHFDFEKNKSDALSMLYMMMKNQK